MHSILTICSEIKPVLTAATIILMIGVAVQIADAPSSEALNPDKVSLYNIDDCGRITDDDGRLRGWIRDGEVYSPCLEIKYRLSGNHLIDSN